MRKFGIEEDKFLMTHKSGTAANDAVIKNAEDILSQQEK